MAFLRLRSPKYCSFVATPNKAFGTPTGVQTSSSGRGEDIQWILVSHYKHPLAHLDICELHTVRQSLCTNVLACILELARKSIEDKIILE